MSTIRDASRPSESVLTPAPTMSSTAGKIGIAPVAPLRSRATRRRLSMAAQPYLLIAPTVVLVFALTAYPIYYLFFLSFHSTQYLRVGGFSGFRNYTQLFTPSGWRSVTATLEFVTGSVILVTVLSLLLALLLEAPLRARGLLRTILIAPWVVSYVVTALLWQALLDPNSGPVAGFFRFAFGFYVAPLSDQRLAMLALIAANVWRTYPIALILLLAAIQSVPTELYEAARLDGAAPWQEFRFIILPTIRRTLMVVMIMLTIESFATSTLPLIMTSGGPSESTYVFSVRIWRQAMTEYRFGASAASGVVVFLVTMIIGFNYLRLFGESRGKDVP